MKLAISSSLILKPGSYSLRIKGGGFEALERVVDLTDANLNLELELSLPVAKEQITVGSRYAQFANSDALYRKLRNVGLGASFRVAGFTFKCDAATFELEQGTLTFLAPVNGFVTGAVFVGTGHFTLKSVTRLAQTEIHRRRLKTDQVEEDFHWKSCFAYSLACAGEVVAPGNHNPNGHSRRQRKDISTLARKHAPAAGSPARIL